MPATISRNGDLLALVVFMLDFNTPLTELWKRCSHPRCRSQRQWPRFSKPLRLQNNGDLTELKMLHGAVRSRPYGAFHFQLFLELKTIYFFFSNLAVCRL